MAKYIINQISAQDAHIMYVCMYVLFTDIKIEHDSCCLCYGMDSSQQALFKGSQNVSGGCGYWCWNLHSK
jgi:hypothetical protein